VTEARQLTDGERWTREQLAALLARRFSPPAVAGFLVASQRRTNAVRRERPALGRQARAWTAAGALAWLAPPVRRHARAGLAWWALTALMLDWHLGMVETDDGEPRPLGTADALTLARCWLVPLAAAGPSPALVALAAATDVLDGRAARATSPTRAGRDLEGLVDACFAGAALRGLVRAGRLDRAVVGAEAVRLGAGVAYGLLVYFGRAERPSERVLRAGRAATGARVGGLALGAAGHRRAGGALLAAGSLWSLVALAPAVRPGASRGSSRAAAASPRP
jgi:phosphatidylglycerophosphate synthase